MSASNWPSTTDSYWNITFPILSPIAYTSESFPPLLSRTLRTVHPTVPRSLFSLAAFPRSSSLILPRDENPRCPPTDTNGHLCQRRNLLLYIPLYKQRVNRAAYELAIGIRAVETDLSIVLRALLLLLLSSRILSLFLRGTSLMCVCIYVCIAYKLEYTRGSVPVPFHQTNFDRTTIPTVLHLISLLVLFFFPSSSQDGVWSFLIQDWAIGRLFLGEFKMENIKLIFRWSFALQVWKGMLGWIA